MEQKRGQEEERKEKTEQEHNIGQHRVLIVFKRYGKQIPKQKKKSYSIFFNKGHVSPSERKLYESIASHVDVESPLKYAFKSLIAGLF